MPATVKRDQFRSGQEDLDVFLVRGSDESRRLIGEVWRAYPTGPRTWRWEAHYSLEGKRYCLPGFETRISAVRHLERLALERTR